VAGVAAPVIRTSDGVAVGSAGYPPCSRSLGGCMSGGAAAAGIRPSDAVPWPAGTAWCAVGAGVMLRGSLGGVRWGGAMRSRFPASVYSSARRPARSRRSPEHLAVFLHCTYGVSLSVVLAPLSLRARGLPALGQSPAVGKSVPRTLVEIVFQNDSARILVDWYFNRSEI
jgi:hypothetical protein